MRFHCLRWAAEAAGAPAAAPAAAPFVLVHGFAQSARSWDMVARALAVATARAVYAIDLVGHGQSERPADPRAYALAAQGRVLLAFVRQVGIWEGVSRPVLVGYSLGGRVALAALLDDPPGFAATAGALVLESAGLGPATEEERAQAAAADVVRAERLRTGGVPAFMDAWERLSLFATQAALPDAVREAVRAERLSNDAEALARTFEHAGQHAMPARTQVVQALHALAAAGVPVRFVAGALDAKYCALAESLPADAGIQTRIVARAGHNVHLERPQAFVQALRGL